MFNTITARFLSLFAVVGFLVACGSNEVEPRGELLIPALTLEAQVEPVAPLGIVEGHVTAPDDASGLLALVHASDYTRIVATGAGGSFVVRGVPAGEHELEVLHPTQGRRATRVVVKQARAVSVSLRFHSRR